MMDSRFGEAALTMTLAALVFGFATAAHAQGKWRAGAPIPQGANEVIGAEIDGQVLVYGGQDPGNNAMGIFWKFDPTKNEWSKLPSNPVPVHHGASASIGHKFYVFGGFRLPDTGKVGWYPENKAWAFDLDTQKWSALPPMPTTRGALAAVAVGQKIYVNGGAGIPQGMQLPDGLVGGGPVDLSAHSKCSIPTPIRGQSLHRCPPRGITTVSPTSTASSTPLVGGWARAIRAVGRRMCG
jgi:N-acetylneuraminic acid mutarotase